MPRAQSVPPASPDDRTTERRLIPSASHGPPGHASTGYGSLSYGPPAESTREVTQEDFLFHLYRGSELLQENRVLEAKEELEFALTMQPSDPKGQDLLGAVYFRLGLYPRAIQIYETLEASFPSDASIKVNLALGYLKTGQPDPARRVLQDAVRIHPEHKRAWGYLGLALQKLGELEPARIAFERGGHELMAKRLADRVGRASSAAPQDGPSSTGFHEGMRSVAETAFSELDAGELRFALAEPGRPKAGDGAWHTVEIGDAARPPPSAPPPPPPGAQRRSVHETATAPPPSFSTRMVPPPLAGSPPAESAPQAPMAPGSVAPSLLGAPPEQAVSIHANGVVLARLTREQAFATRLDALRVISGAMTTRVLHRRVRDAEANEVLGGIGSPFVRAAGDAQIVLGARPSHQLSVIALEEEMAFVREDSLLGFELRLAYESGRLALDPPGEGPRSSETVHVVQLRGSGAVVMEITGALSSLPCATGVPLFVRREWIVGWLGRLVPRALPPTESPSGQRGLVSFAGDGMVLVSAV
jgi:uncharacterized protein (AIM24 family)